MHVNLARFVVPRKTAGLGGVVRRATAAGVGRPGIERVLQQNPSRGVAATELRQLTRETGRAPIVPAPQPGLAERLATYKANKPAPAPTFLERMAAEAERAPTLTPRSKLPMAVLGGSAAGVGAGAAVAAGLPGAVADTASAVGAIPGKIFDGITSLQQAGAATPTVEPPAPTTLPTELQGNPIWKYLPHAGLAAAGGLGLYSMYQNAKRQEEQAKQVPLVNMLPKTAAEQAQFVADYPFVAGFLVACHDAGLSELQIREKIAIAARIDVDFAEEFHNAFVKEAIGLHDNMGPMVPKPPSVAPAPAATPAPKLNLGAMGAPKPPPVVATPPAAPRGVLGGIGPAVRGGVGALAGGIGSVGAALATPVAHAGEWVGALPEGSGDMVNNVQEQMHGLANAGAEQFLNNQTSSAFDDALVNHQEQARPLMGQANQEVMDRATNVSLTAAGNAPMAVGGGKAVGAITGLDTANQAVQPSPLNTANPNAPHDPVGVEQGIGGEMAAAEDATALSSQAPAGPQPGPGPAPTQTPPQQPMAPPPEGVPGTASQGQPGAQPLGAPAKPAAPPVGSPPQAWDDFAKAITDDPSTPVNEKLDAIKPFVEQVTGQSGLPPEEIAKFVQQAETQGLQPSQMQDAFKRYSEQLAASNPEAMQQPGFIEQAYDSFTKMDGGTQALLGLGLGLGVIGLMNSASGGNGLGSILMMLLGFGTAAFTGAQGGLFGQGAQGMAGSLSESIGGMFGGETPPQPGEGFQLDPVWQQQLDTPNSALNAAITEGLGTPQAKFMRGIPGVGGAIVKSRLITTLQQKGLEPQTAKAIAEAYLQKQQAPGAGQTSQIQPAQLDGYQSLRAGGNPNLPNSANFAAGLA